MSVGFFCGTVARVRLCVCVSVCVCVLISCLRVCGSAYVHGCLFVCVRYCV